MREKKTSEHRSKGMKERQEKWSLGVVQGVAVSGVAWRGHLIRHVL